MIVDIPFAAAFQFDTYVAIRAAVLLWLCVLRNYSLARWGGIIMLLGYGAYFLYIL